MKKESRVAIFLPSLRGGGAENAMANLAAEFCRRGLTVDLLLPICDGPFLGQLPDEVTIVDLRAKRVLFSLPALVRYLRRVQPEVLLSAIDHSNIIALCAIKLAKVRTRVFISVRSTMSLSVKHTNYRSLLIPFMARWLYPGADGVIAVSGGVADDLSRTIGICRARIQVIHNPLPWRRIEAMSAEPVNHPWFRLGEPPVVLSVGRLTDAKDYPTLLRAFSLVTRRCPARLMILGEGERRGGLERMAQELGLEESVCMPGFQENPYSYMSKSAVFVLSSAWEGYPNVLVEALACGTAVVSTDCPSGPAEILNRGQYGQLVTVGDADSLAAAIVATLDRCRPPAKISDLLKRITDQAVTAYLCELGLDL